MPLPLAIYYEHPDWFRPLFAELDQRGVDYVKLDARRHRYDPSVTTPAYSLVFNRMSPSAYLRGVGHGLFYTLNWLHYLESIGTRVVNGSQAFAVELSKARQLTLWRRWACRRRAASSSITRTKRRVRRKVFVFPSS